MACLPQLAFCYLMHRQWLGTNNTHILCITILDQHMTWLPQAIVVGVWPDSHREPVVFPMHRQWPGPNTPHISYVSPLRSTHGLALTGSLLFANTPSVAWHQCTTHILCTAIAVGTWPGSCGEPLVFPMRHQWRGADTDIHKLLYCIYCII